MPYTHKKVGDQYVVYKGSKKVGATKGTKEALKKYLAALHIADEKTKKESKSLKESMGMGMPSMENSWEHPGCEDKIGKMFVVLKPSPESTPEDIVHQTHAFGMGQFEPHGVHGVYADKDEADLVAEAACTELYKHLSEVEKKKDHVIGEIEKHIARLQKEINAHMKEATNSPELAEGHHGLAEKKMNVIRALRSKHKMVKEAKKELPKKEEE
jgi:hypothetical protein